MDVALFKTAQSTREGTPIEAAPDPDIGPGVGPQELIDGLYNRRTSFTVCCICGIKIELASPSPGPRHNLTTPFLTHRDRRRIHAGPHLAPLLPTEHHYTLCWFYPLLVPDLTRQKYTSDRTISSK